MAALRKALEPIEVHIAPMRRRHLRSVLRIEAQVYPKPSSPRSDATSSGMPA